MTLTEALETIYDEWEELTRFIDPSEKWPEFLLRRLTELGGWHIVGTGVAQRPTAR